LIGGSIVEADNYALYNSSYIFNRGQMLGRYRKLNPVDGELRRGILPGDKFFAVEVEGIRIGVMICADALNADLFEAINSKAVDIIFIPTTSPFREGEGKREKQKRDLEIFQTGAQKASSFIVKTCGVGSLFGKRLQGRSLIASPWSIIKRVDIFAESSRCILTATLDIDEIREFRRHQKIARIVEA
jgi:predicted amidohydrolase